MEAFYSRRRRTFHEAHEFCNKCGGNLPRPKNQDDVDMLINFFLEQDEINAQDDLNGIEGFFVGATRDSATDQ